MSAKLDALCVALADAARACERRKVDLLNAAVDERGATSEVLAYLDAIDAGNRIADAIDDERQVRRDEAEAYTIAALPEPAMIDEPCSPEPELDEPLRGGAADRERHVTERAEQIARAFGVAMFQRGWQLRRHDGLQLADGPAGLRVVFRDLIDRGVLK